MKTINKLFWLMTLVAITFSGCKKDDPEPTLSVSPNAAISFTAEALPAEAVTITVTTNQASWDAVSSRAWCKVIKNTDGKTFTVSADPNTSATAPAPATIVVTAGQAPALSIAVTQGTPALFVSPSAAISFTAAALPAEAVTVTVTTNQASWDAVSDQAWCIVTKAAGTFTVTAAPNTSGTAPAPATITVSAPSAANVTIAVTQQPVVTIAKALIPKGTFQMGSSVMEPNRWTDETQHSVTLTRDFYMSKYEITNAQYAAFLNANAIGSDGKWAAGPDPDEVLVVASPSSDDWGLRWSTNRWEPVWGKDNFPVICVTWYGAKAFAGWAGGALPTEAQWEYACRGGQATSLPFGVGDGTKLYADQANFIGSFPYDVAFGGTRVNYSGPTPPATYLAKTAVVGGYAPNGYGLYDMHGNVWEWCSDWYADNFGSANASDSATDPAGPATGTRRVLRGGSWAGFAQWCRSASRHNFDPDGAYSSIGFRVVFLP